MIRRDLTHALPEGVGQLVLCRLLTPHYDTG